MGNIVSDFNSLIKGEISLEKRIKVYKFVLFSDLKRTRDIYDSIMPKYPICINFGIETIGDDSDVWVSPFINWTIQNYINTCLY